MTDIERRLEQAYAASDVLLADWDTDQDFVTPLGALSRPVRWFRSPRALYPLLTAAAITAAVVIGTVSFGRDAPDRRTSPGNAASTTAVSAVSTPAASTPNKRAPMTAAERGAANAKVLQRLIPDLRKVTVGPEQDVDVVDAEYWPGGQHLANLFLMIVPKGYSYSPDFEGGNPCTLQPGDAPGRQGHPAPEDRCTSFPQADGTVVWVRRADGHSASRPWTTAKTKHWTFIHRRLNGMVVSLEVTSEIGDLNTSLELKEATVPFDIPDATLLAMVTSADIAVEPPCGRKCQFQEPPPPPGVTPVPEPSQS